MRYYLRKTIRSLIPRRFRIYMMHYLDNRELKKLERNQNIIDYSFNEEAERNEIVVKDIDGDVPTCMWGAPVSVFTYDNKAALVYRKSEIKNLVYTTNGSKILALLFDLVD